MLIRTKATLLWELTCPFELNEKCNLDVNFFFSGLKLEVWFRASSYVELKCPFKLNKDGNLDMDFFFSGIELKVWFKASINDKNNDEEAKIKS